MTDVFWMLLDSIQPSQLYISAKKLARVQQRLDSGDPDSLEPIPLKELGGRVVYTDGHTRAFAAYLAGWERIRVLWDEDELDWEAYQICVDWCLDAGIYTIADLEGRVISQEEYDVLWYRRCAEMQEKGT